jgi:hypothetical protein
VLRSGLGVRFMVSVWISFIVSVRPGSSVRVMVRLSLRDEG